MLLGLDATVVTICHRLNHVARFDLVFVLEAGRVVERGAPADLLARDSSLLSNLVRHAGLSGAAMDGGGRD